MKKIMFFIFNLKGGGAERTLINIINNLDKSKFDVTLVIGNNNNDYDHLVDNEIKVVNLNVNRHRKTLVPLVKHLNSNKYDLLFTTINENNIMLSVAKALSWKCKAILIVREANHRSASNKVSFLNKAITKLSYNLVANHVVALSKGVKSDLIDFFGISEDKISVIYNPVEISKIQISADEILNDKEVFKESYKTLIAVGRLAEAKDYFTLIKALELINNKVKTKLLILGKGPLENVLKQYSAELNLSDNIVFKGFEQNPYKYIKNSDVFILSSKWEGFGHVIAESLAVGTPVVATNCKSGPSEIIQDQVSGFLVPVGDHVKIANKVLEILNSEKLSSNFKKNGLLQVEKFSASRIVKEYEKLFKDLLIHEYS